MAQQFDEWDDDDTDFNPNESNALREVRKALRAAEKREKALAEELESYRVQARTASIKSMLAERNLSPKIAAFVPDDVSGSEALGKWLDEFGDVFTPVQVQEEQPQADQAPDGAAKFNEVVSNGAPPTGDEAQLAALIKGASTPAELNKILFGNPTGPVL